MLIKDIENVARHLGIYYSEDNGIIIVNDHDPVDFEPDSNDADAMQVFKALVDECNDRGLIITVSNGYLEVSGTYIDNCKEGLNESICLAYLKIMESK